MNARRPAIGPILTPDHRMRRLEFAQEHRNWRMHEWESVLFTDESRFHLSTCDRRVRVWRRRGGRGTPSVPLLKLTYSVVGHLWFKVEFV